MHRMWTKGLTAVLKRLFVPWFWNPSATRPSLLIRVVDVIGVAVIIYLEIGLIISAMTPTLNGYVWLIVIQVIALIWYGVHNKG